MKLRFPHLRLLDFRKITVAHRKEAVGLFKSKRGKELLKEIAKKTKSNIPTFAAIDSSTKGLSINSRTTVLFYLSQIFVPL